MPPSQSFCSLPRIILIWLALPAVTRPSHQLQELQETSPDQPVFEATWCKGAQMLWRLGETPDLTQITGPEALMHGAFDRTPGGVRGAPGGWNFITRGPGFSLAGRSRLATARDSGRVAGTMPGAFIGARPGQGRAAR